MSLGKFLGPVGAVALAASLTFGSANAVTLAPMLASQIVAPDTAYKFSQAAPLPTGSDTFDFIYAGGLATASAFSFTNPNPPVGQGGGFTGFKVEFLEGAVAQVSHTFVVGESSFSFTALFPDLTVDAATLYHLIVSWIQPAGATGTYATTLVTGPAEVTRETPLPPAALLFVSALAGLGLLGRRRMTKGKAAALAS